jgi:hypothetical protein
VPSRRLSSQILYCVIGHSGVNSRPRTCGSSRLACDFVTAVLEQSEQPFERRHEDRDRHYPRDGNQDEHSDDTRTATPGPLQEDPILPGASTYAFARRPVSTAGQALRERAVAAGAWSVMEEVRADGPSLAAASLPSSSWRLRGSRPPRRRSCVEEPALVTSDRARNGPLRRQSREEFIRMRLL